MMLLKVFPYVRQRTVMQCFAYVRSRTVTVFIAAGMLAMVALQFKSCE